MATKVAAKKPSPFGKPKPAAAKDGTFEFQLPENLGSGRGRIPKGKYVGKCVGIESDTSQNSGNPMWVWDFVITAGPQAGRNFRLWTVLTEDAAWKIVETLAGLGIKLKAGDRIKINRKQVIGVGCTLHVKDDAGQDKDAYDDEGNPMYSKLDKISAHPKGAGYRSGSLGSGKAAKEVDPEDDRDYPAEFDEGGAEEEEVEEEEETEPEEEEEGVEEEGEEEEEEEPEPPRRKPSAAAKRGRAPVKLGGKRR